MSNLFRCFGRGTPDAASVGDAREEAREQDGLPIVLPRNVEVSDLTAWRPGAVVAMRSGPETSIAKKKHAHCT